MLNLGGFGRILSLVKDKTLSEFPDLGPINRAQQEVLSELQHSSVVAFSGVGSGKTLMAELAGTVLGLEPKDILLVIPASMRKNTEKAWKQDAPRFNVTLPGTVISYHDISSASWGPLSQTPFKLVILDEAHMISGEQSARHKRLARYIRTHNPRVLAMSGSFFDSSMEDLAHLANCIFGEKSPFPIKFPELIRLSNCACGKGSVGEYLTLVPAIARILEMYPDVFSEIPDYTNEIWSRDRIEWAVAKGGWGLKMLSTMIRVAWAEVFKDIPGCVMTSPYEINIPLSITVYKDESDRLREHKIRLIKDNVLPNGDIVSDSLSLARAKETLARGFYLYWDWPGEPDYEWLDAWRLYNQHINSLVRGKFDTPGLVVANLHQINHDESIIRAWEEQSHKPKPPTAAEWLTDFYIEKALELSDEKTLIWYTHIEVGHKFKEYGIPVLFAGDQEPDEACRIALPSRAFGTGKRLEAWSKSLLFEYTSSARMIEQVIGRTHRPGQEAPVVEVAFFTDTSFRGLLERVDMRADLERQRQKMQLAKPRRVVFS